MKDTQPSHTVHRRQDFGVLFGRLVGTSYLKDIWDIIIWSVTSVLFLGALSIIFISLGPKSTISQNLGLWTATYIAPVLLVMISLKLSEPALRLRKFVWSYKRIYTFLAFLVGIYALTLNLAMTNLVGLLVSVILTLLLLTSFPVVRNAAHRTRQISFAFAVAIGLLLTPATQVGKVNSTLTKLGGKSALIQSTKADRTYGVSRGQKAVC